MERYLWPKSPFVTGEKQGEPEQYKVMPGTY